MSGNQPTRSPVIDIIWGNQPTRLPVIGIISGNQPTRLSVIDIISGNQRTRSPVIGSISGNQPHRSPVSSISCQKIRKSTRSPAHRYHIRKPTNCPSISRNQLGSSVSYQEINQLDRLSSVYQEINQLDHLLIHDIISGNQPTRSPVIDIISGNQRTRSPVIIISGN